MMIRIFVTAFCFFLLGGGYAVADERSDRVFENPAAAPPAIPCAPFLPGCDKVQDDELTDFRKNRIFGDIIPSVLGWLMAFTTGTAVLMGVVSGVMFVFGGQNDELLSKAKKTAMYAIVGLLVAMFAYFIVEMVNRLPFPNAARQ
jgi:hypothetical protein